MSEPTTVEGTLPDGLLEAFDAYEAALAADDQVALGDAFEDGATTIRSDASGLLLGHDAITAFRGARKNAPVRRIVELHVRVLGADAAVIVSVNAPAAGGRGVVTQLWRREGSTGVWRVAVAQVQAPSPAIDTRVWRVVGVRGEAGPEHPGDVSGGGDHVHPRVLAGETIAVKDLFAVAGERIGGGVPAYLAGQEAQPAHAPALAALVDAGATIAGIAQTDEFAYSIAGRNSAYGTPPNPAVPGAISGGSTSGPATAVSLGQASIGLGTDTGGSIRVPASYQGLWGLRTTHSAVSREGLLPLAPTFDTVGWLTRDVDLLARVAEVGLEGSAAAGDVRQSTVEPVFVLPSGESDLAGLVSAEVAGAVRSTMSALVEAGACAGVGAVDLGELAPVFEAFRVVQAAEAWRSHGSWITEHPGALAPDVEARFRFGRSIDADREKDARAQVARHRDRFDDLLAGRILVLPSASSAAPQVSAPDAEFDRVRTQTLTLTSVAGTGGYPALSMPLVQVLAQGGRTAPLGLCLVGPRGTDLALVRVGSRLAAHVARSR